MKPLERCLAEEAVVKDEGADSGKVAERGDAFAELTELLIESGRLKESGRLPGCVRRLPAGSVTALKTSVEAGAERVTRLLPRFAVVFSVVLDARELNRPVGGAESDHSSTYT